MGAETFQEFKERVKPLLRSSREMSLKDLVKTGKKPIVLSQYGHMKEISYLKNFDLIVMEVFQKGIIYLIYQLWKRYQSAQKN